MTTRDEQLIALVLGDAPAPPELARWLATDAGRRELAAYRAALAAFEALHADRPRPEPVIYYCTMASPIGRLHVAAGEAGVVRIGFGGSEASFVDGLGRLGVAVVRSAAKTADVVHQLRTYFAGERRTFDVRVDLSRVTPFQRRVLMAAAGVPAGKVVSYGEIARRIGQPGGSRAVGQALGSNPIPIVIPCHRIIAAGGKIGGYGGGLARKRKLLRLEGAAAVG
jgi:methylated-DNA-[protein]-cysteine S-methyltransferase